MRSRSRFDKYDLYRRAVQSPENDVAWMRKIYRRLRGKEAVQFREDFCGTGLLSATWVKQGPRCRATGLDISAEPMRYGRDHWLAELTDEQRERVGLMARNVLSPAQPRAQIVAAVNFSYFVFRERRLLLRYFRNVRRSLVRGGIFVLDVFGGSDCMGPCVDVRREHGFTYYWEQEDYDPISQEARFHIHFRVGRRMRKRVFSYHWRLWSIPELREILAEAGFRDVHVYWEGTNSRGRGNGVFTRREKGESCEGWVAYLVAEV